MIGRARLRSSVAALAILAAACAPTAAAPSASPSPRATAAPTSAPSASPAAVVTEFVTADGYWTMGKLDAKVLFVDSSDFG